MKLVALLSWFDELPEHLIDLVRSLTDAGVDELVAVDGAYGLYPGGLARSGESQYIALQASCAAGGIGLTVHTPRAAWAGNEVEKRTQLFSLGHAVAEPYDDWLWVVDGDELVTRADDVRDVLEATDCDVGSVLEWENGTPKRLERRLFRAHPKGIGVLGAHFYYRNGDGDVLWGPRQVESVELPVEVFHRPLARAEARNKARNGYYEARLQSNVEREIH